MERRKEGRRKEREGAKTSERASEQANYLNAVSINPPFCFNRPYTSVKFEQESRNRTVPTVRPVTSFDLLRDPSPLRLFHIHRESEFLRRCAPSSSTHLIRDAHVSFTLVSALSLLSPLLRVCRYPLYYPLALPYPFSLVRCTVSFFARTALFAR